MGKLHLSLVCECMVLAECQQDRMDDKLKQEFDDLLKKIKWPIRDKLRAQVSITESKYKYLTNSQSL